MPYHHGLLNQPDPDPPWGRPRVPQSLISAAEEWGRNPQRPMVSPQGASIGPPQSRMSRIWDHLRHGIPRRVEEFLEPETPAGLAGLLGASVMEPAGTAIDVADFAAGLQDRDLGRMGWATGGILLPLVAGSTLRKVGGEVAEAIKKRKVWHGTDQDILDTPRLSPHDETPIDAFSVSTDFDEAQKYADNTMQRTGPGTERNPATGRVYEYEIPEDKIVDYSDFWSLVADEFGGWDKIPEGFDIAEEARRRGYVAFDMAKGLGRGEIAVIDPTALSSKLEYRPHFDWNDINWPDFQ